MAFGDLYRGRRVLVTGHTGFKGAWLTLWLAHSGADVTGYALAPEDPAILLGFGRVCFKMDLLDDAEPEGPPEVSLLDGRERVV